MTNHQPSLFDTAPPPWEVDDAGEQLVATVVFATGPEQPFDYAVPDRLSTELVPGQRLRVPFGKGDRPHVGYCVEVATRHNERRRLKQVHSIVDRRPLLSAPMLRLTRWMSEYYLSPWGQVLETVIPAGVRSQAGTRETLFLTVPNQVAARLSQLKLSEKQHQILTHLAASPRPLTIQELTSAVHCTSGPITSLRSKGLIEANTKRVDTGKAFRPIVLREEHLEMNDDQKFALDAILAPLKASRHETILIHGVTGSGKTEVYIQAIQEVLSYGRQAIVLVPEISLTPQTEQRFRSRFGEVAVLHSHLSDVERHRHWQRIAAGDVHVVVGARSAVFAPTPNLGLIVLDEEHESSFKQGETPRYHARDVALERARAENIPLVLGSATPSLESWQRTLPPPQNAATGAPRPERFRLISMPRRVFDRPMPAVGVIDLRTEFQDRRSRGAVSRQLHQAMEAALKDGGQVILLLNRRGFSTHIQCPACGMVLRCPECSIALTHHLHAQVALCHYCEYQTHPPKECPDCRFPGIRYGGLGTQKLESEVRARFGGYQCLRMDTDTMQKPGSHEKALAAFRAGEVQILLGTQMIAKGLDFPNVTLVGVINADTALHIPDFRASERTFQLVTQVAGRTGRGERGGRVLVQTFSPDHPAIVAAMRHDFEQFARNELPQRADHLYPPCASMVRIIVRGLVEAAAHELAEQIADRIRGEVERMQFAARVLGPAPAPIAKLRGMFRFHLQVQAADGERLRQAIRQATAQIKPLDDLQWVVDVDPLDML